MKKISVLWLICLVLLVSIGMAGCAQSEAKSNPPVQPIVKTSAVETSGETKKPEPRFESGKNRHSPISFGKPLLLNLPETYMGPGSAQEITVIDATLHMNNELVFIDNWLTVKIQFRAVTDAEYKESVFKVVGSKGVIHGGWPLTTSLLAGTTITKELRFNVAKDDSDFIFIWDPYTSEYRRYFELKVRNPTSR